MPTPLLRSCSCGSPAAERQGHEEKGLLGVRSERPLRQPLLRGQPGIERGRLAELGHRDLEGPVSANRLRLLDRAVQGGQVEYVVRLGPRKLLGGLRQGCRHAASAHARPRRGGRRGGRSGSGGGQRGGGELQPARRGQRMRPGRGARRHRDWLRQHARLHAEVPGHARDPRHHRPAGHGRGAEDGPTGRAAASDGSSGGGGDRSGSRGGGRRALGDGHRAGGGPEAVAGLEALAPGDVAVEAREG
mmetsp:Transcript_10903/g.29121  ORF Transcript_10903/g.29121 Transcript_10903/m.29121 type:complete len:246 (-) Transcript_10903:1326-2063(-)